MMDDYVRVLLAMRENDWRTAYGAMETLGYNEAIGEGCWMDYAGDGKITLWPALLDYFPKERHAEGYGYLLFDTVMSGDVNPVQKVSGDVSLEATQHWQDNTSVLKWHYTDPGGALSVLNAAPSKLRSYWTGTEPRIGRPMAADGATSGLNLQWEF